MRIKVHSVRGQNGGRGEGRGRGGEEQNRITQKEQTRAGPKIKARML